MHTKFTQAIHQATDSRFFPIRMADAFKTIVQHKGLKMGALATLTAGAASVYSVAFSYFALEGSVRALMSISEIEDPVVRLRPLGDAGGWSCLAFFSVYALGTFFNQFMREGEYLKLKSVCQKWIENHREEMIEDPKFHRALYKKIDQVLASYSTQCLISKNAIERKRKTLKIFKKSGLKIRSKKHRQDKEMKSIFAEIQTSLVQARHPLQYMPRIYAGQKAIWQKKGWISQLGTLILGVAIPTLLMTSAVLSFIGEVGLGKEIFLLREELGDIGHFGEWPINAIEAIGVAFLLHAWCMINEGDLAGARKVYALQLEKLLGNRKHYNHLCQIANQELDELAARCQIFKLPIDYQFEKI